MRGRRREGRLRRVMAGRETEHCCGRARADRPLCAERGAQVSHDPLPTRAQLSGKAPALGRAEGGLHAPCPTGPRSVPPSGPIAVRMPSGPVGRAMLSSRWSRTPCKVDGRPAPPWPSFTTSMPSKWLLRLGMACWPIGPMAALRIVDHVSLVPGPTCVRVSPCNPTP